MHSVLQVIAAGYEDRWREWEALSRDVLQPVLQYLTHLLLSDLGAMIARVEEQLLATAALADMPDASTEQRVKACEELVKFANSMRDEVRDTYLREHEIGKSLIDRGGDDA